MWSSNVFDPSLNVKIRFYGINNKFTVWILEFDYIGIYMHRKMYHNDIFGIRGRRDQLEALDLPRMKPRRRHDSSDDDDDFVMLSWRFLQPTGILNGADFFKHAGKKIGGHSEKWHVESFVDKEWWMICVYLEIKSAVGVRCLLVLLADYLEPVYRFLFAAHESTCECYRCGCLWR